MNVKLHCTELRPKMSLELLAFSLIPLYICWPFLNYLSTQPSLYSLICSGSLLACPAKQTEQV